MRRVAVLCVRPGSVYRRFDGVECYDAARDALTFDGRLPVVAHPPCRLAGRLKAFARPADRAREMSLLSFCVAQVRACGGVLEHPAASSLWTWEKLPAPGCADEFGFTVAFPQYWFGHAARKDSWFYVCGVDRRALPEIPLRLEGLDVQTVDRLSRMQREATPVDLATWLLAVARRAGA